MISLKNKNILVTGASSGLGKQCAISCAEAGANVILIARDNAKLNSVLDQMAAGNHILYSQDLMKYDEIEGLVADAVSKNGPLSGFIHSAGLEKTIPINGMKAETYLELFSINTISAFELARIVSKKKYIAKEGGSFVFISSIMAELGQKGKVGYCSSKSALSAGSKALALELAPKKIRVNTIEPAVVETEMTTNMFGIISEDAKKGIIDLHPLGIGQPSDVANLCMFLLSDLSPWITGTGIVIDGGYSCQ